MFTRFMAVGFVLIFLLGPVSAWAQALPNLNSLRVRYNTQKSTVKPDGDLKVQIDQIDKEIGEATRAGRTGDVRKLFAKGLALLAGRPWTEVEEFQSSLVLRTSSVVVDSSQPQVVRLEQIFAPTTALTKPLTAIATIRPPAPPAAAGQPATSEPGTEIGRFEQVARDLRESPFAMDLDLSKIADGTQVLSVEVKDGERSLGTVSLRMAIQKGLDARLRQLESAAATASADIRPDLQYPADYIRKINRGVVELGQFNVASELGAAESIVAAAKGGKNPFVGRTGGFERHYVLETAREIMPYRAYVPTTYNGSKPYPLIVALHGLGANEDSFMDSYAKTVPTLAEQRGDRQTALEYYAQAASDSSPAGQAAQDAAVRLDLPANPGKYIQARGGLDNPGHLVVEVANPTGVTVTDVLVAVRYADSQGAIREVGRRIDQLPPRQATRFATGLGPFTSAQQFQVGVTNARVARND